METQNEMHKNPKKKKCKNDIDKTNIKCNRFPLVGYETKLDTIDAVVC